MSHLFEGARRPWRVGELLCILWLLSLFDLAFTLWAHFFTDFHELNPIAAQMLVQRNFSSLVLFKVVSTLIATSIFWRLRTLTRAELALWFLIGAYVIVSFRWSEYTHATAITAVL